MTRIYHERSGFEGTACTVTDAPDTVHSGQLDAKGFATVSGLAQGGVSVAYDIDRRTEFEQQDTREPGWERWAQASEVRADAATGAAVFVADVLKSPASFASLSAPRPSMFGEPQKVQIGLGGAVVPNYEYAGSDAFQVPMAAPAAVASNFLGTVQDSALS